MFSLNRGAVKSVRKPSSGRATGWRRRFESLERRELLHGAIDGFWDGSTALGRVFDMDVANHEVTHVKIGAFVAGPGCSSTITLDLNGHLPINDSHAFSYAFQAGRGGISFAIAGTFTSDDTASGTLQVTVEPPFPGQLGCPGSISTTWTATQPPPPLPSVVLTQSTDTIAEQSGQTTVTATLSAPALLPVTINLGRGGTAGPNDVQASSDTISIPVGQTSGFVVLSALDDAMDEPDETVTTEITSVTNAVELGDQLVTTTIVDDDPQPTVVLEFPGGNSVAESGGAVIVKAKLSAPTAFPISIELAFGGTAGNPGDYSLSAQTIEIPADHSEGITTLNIVNDAFDELDEKVDVEIVSATNAVELDEQSLTLTIVDEDVPPTASLSIAPGEIAEGGGTATVTVTLSELSELPVHIDLSFSGAALIDIDYVADRTITIPAGQLTGASVITAIDDAVMEQHESIVVGFSGVQNATPADLQQVIAHILDDEPVPGDTNGDRVVDLVDLNNVRNGFGGQGVLGDADGDGDVDLSDLNAVRNYFGDSPAQASASSLAIVQGHRKLRGDDFGTWDTAQHSHVTDFILGQWSDSSVASARRRGAKA